MRLCDIYISVHAYVSEGDVCMSDVCMIVRVLCLCVSVVYVHVVNEHT